MDKSAEQVAQNRLSMLRLAEHLRNVSEACRRHGISRTRFYEYKKRYVIYGLEGVKNLLPPHRIHPQTKPLEVVEKVLGLSIANPLWGCSRLRRQLHQEGVSISGPTIQKILIRNGMGSMEERASSLEKLALERGGSLTPAQTSAVEKVNPAFSERHEESSRPGELLVQDSFFLAKDPDKGKLYLQAVVDTFCGYVFGFLHFGKYPHHAVSVLNSRVLKKYEGWGLKVKAVLTDEGREYRGGEDHPYGITLGLNGIEHREAANRQPWINGFLEVFRRNVFGEFCRKAFLGRFEIAIESLQEDLDDWIRFYNEERPQPGYRNMGRTPCDVVKAWIESRGSHLQEVQRAASACRDEASMAGDSDDMQAKTNDVSVRREGSWSR